MSKTPPVTAGILVKIAPGQEESVTIAARQILGAETVAESLDTPTNWFRITRPGETEAPEVGFAQAHAMLTVPGVLWAEPNIKGRLGDNTEESSPLATGVPDPTRDKWTWPVEQIEAREARDQFKVRGRNVRIASLDTGVTQHPELVMGTRVRFDLGYNFVEDVTDSIEPLKASRGMVQRPPLLL
jgi:hypothetical protein